MRLISIDPGETTGVCIYDEIPRLKIDDHGAAVIIPGLEKREFTFHQAPASHPLWCRPLR